MKIHQLNFLLIVTAFVFMLISGCSESKDPTSPELTITDNGGSGSLTLAKGTAEIEQIITYMQQNNMEQGAFFFDVSDVGYTQGRFDFVNGYIVVFSGNFGPGDFLRMNPDSTFSTHLVTNHAEAWYMDLFTGESFDGTGHMNFNFSGTELVYIPGIAVFMLPEPSLNAAVLNGRATVTLNGEGGDPHTVHMRWVFTPGQQNHFRVTFK